MTICVSGSSTNAFLIILVVYYNYEINRKGTQKYAQKR